MSLSASITVGQDEATPQLNRLLAALEDRTRLHASVAARAENVTRDYLISIAQTRHKTAEQLGANPTGHLSRAAESVTSESDASKATVSIISPGISRAFGDLIIKPKNGKYLTIPATAEAYGRRARSFNDLRLAFFKGGQLALVKAEQSSLETRQRSGYDTERKNARPPLKDAGRGTIYYWLEKEVTVKQDRTLLPSDDLLAAAAEEGAVDYLTMLLEAVETVNLS